MQFNFTTTKEIGAIRTRAKRIVLDGESIIYELENRINMKNGSSEFYEVGSLKAKITGETTINSIDINTGKSLGTKSSIKLIEDMREKANFIVTSYTDKDFTVSTEAGTSYSELKQIIIDNKYGQAPDITFLFNDVLVLSSGQEKRIERDSLNISLKMDITNIPVVTTLMSLNQDIFDIMVHKSNNLTEEDRTWLI